MMRRFLQTPCMESCAAKPPEQDGEDYNLGSMFEITNVFIVEDLATGTVPAARLNPSS